MVSIQESNSPERSKTMQLNLDAFTNKRKGNDESGGIWGKRIRSAETTTTKSILEIELQLETPLPLEWQRCLDIQSGQIHFYNTRTRKRTSMDPRRLSHDPQSPAESSNNNNNTNMSLELELNLPCDSQRKINKHNFGSSILKEDYSSNKLANKKNFLELDEEDGIEEEMVAIVCERCHLLVMICKSSPSCPNCKFMHSTHHSSPNQFNQQPTLFASCATYL